MADMNTAAFDQLLAAARAQPDPQVLLFVFAGCDLPAHATAAQRTRYEQGRGGTLTPLMCVEKALDELSTFEALVDESRAVGPPWEVVFAAGVGGQGGQPPAPQAVDAALQAMVEQVNQGAVDRLLALSRRGEALAFA